MDSLPSEVERALQHAIGQANRTYTIGLPHTHQTDRDQRGKAKKRIREDTHHGEQINWKKRKKNHTESGGSAPAVDVNIDPALVNPVIQDTPDGENKEKKKRKRKRREDKDTLSFVALPPPVDPEINLTPMLEGQSTTTLSKVDSSIPQSLYPVSTPSQQASLPGLHIEEDPFSHLNTNDDILRAFQDLDLTRLAGVLRSLDLPSSSQSTDDINLNAPGNPFTTLLGAGDVLEDQQIIPGIANVYPAATSSAQSRRTLETASPSTMAKRGPTPPKPIPNSNPNLAAIGPSIANPEHTKILATKWLGAAKLKELSDTEGLVYKKGKFSVIEEQALKTAVENYRVKHGLLPDQITEVVFSKAKEVNNKFWSEITASVPARPIIAVYHHMRRTYHPLKLQGKWSEEEDIALIKAVADLGQAWQRVSDRVGRTAPDCRDRWRNHLQHRSQRQNGSWSKAEEEELTRIVQKLTTEEGKNSDNDIFWGIVSQRMENTRGRQQCRIKWTDGLNKTVKNGGQNPRWNKRDAFILVHKVASMDVRDDSEIDWKLLADDDWNFWSAHALQRRWRALRHAIKGHDEMTFNEIVEILKQKNVEPLHIQDSPSKSTRKEPKSAAVINEDEGYQTRGAGC